MNGWLRKPERLPAYFARDTEPLEVVPPRRGPRELHPRALRHLARRVATAFVPRNERSAAAW